MATKEEIQALAAKPYSELTPEERRLVNLNKGFWEKGVGGNPKGKKKGCKNWSSIFQKLMGDEKFLHTVITSLPKDWQDIVQDTPAEVIAAGLVANIVKGVAKSLTSDQAIPKEVREAIALLNKISYGDKIVHDSDEGFFAAPVINYEVVPDRQDFKNDKQKEE